MRRRLVRGQFHVRAAGEVVSPREEILPLNPSGHAIAVALQLKYPCSCEAAENDHEPDCCSERLHH